MVSRPVDVVIIGPDELRDVTVDWTGDLPTGAVITGSTFVPEVGLTVGSQTFANAATAARLSWEPGEHRGRHYTVLNRVTLSDGEIYVYPFDVQCKP